MLVESEIPLAIGICNPSSTVKKSVIQSLKSGIHSMESTIQDCFVSDSSPVVSLYLSLVVRGGRRKARERDFLLFSLPITPCSRRARFAKTTGNISGLELPYTGRLINGWIWVHIGFIWTIRNRLNFATVLSYIFARLRRITFKFGNFSILKTLFPVVSTNFL